MSKPSATHRARVIAHLRHHGEHLARNARQMKAHGGAYRHEAIADNEVMAKAFSPAAAELEAWK